MKHRILTILLLSNIYVQAQETDKPFAILKKHKAAATALCYSPSGKYLVSGSEDKTAIVWDLATYEPLHILEGHASKVQAIVYSPIGDILYTGGDNFIRIWDNWKQKSVLSGPSTYFVTLSINPSGSMITGGTLENSPKVWNILKPEKTLRKLEKHKKSTLVSKFSPDGKYIITGSLDLTINLWSADSFKVLKTFNGHSGNIFDIAWAADSKHFISASADKNLIFWCTDSAVWLRKLIGHTGSVSSVVLTPDKYFAISSSIDKSVRIWELSSGKDFYQLDFKETPNCVTLNKDGSQLAVALSDGTIHLYKFDNQWVVNSFYKEEVEKELDASPLFKPKGKDENREAYEKRSKEALEYRNTLYNNYFVKYKQEHKPGW